MESSGNREKFFLKKNFWEAFSKRQEVIMWTKLEPGVRYLKKSDTTENDKRIDRTPRKVQEQFVQI